MQIQTVLFILLAAIVALALVLFQYYYKNKRKGQLYIVLSFLRFIAIFATLLLIINPKFVKNQYQVEKANLVMLTDNSSSIKAADSAKVLSLLGRFTSGETEVNDRFNIVQYSFGDGLNTADSLTFNEEGTNISKALASLNEIYKGSNTAVVLFTDGNQTVGEDYEFYGERQKFPVFPVVLGDTTSYEDLSISQLNLNRYAFLKNKFPLEMFISYDGKQEVNTQVKVYIDDKLVFSEGVSLSMVSNTKIITAQLDASAVGVKNIKVRVAPLVNEKNKANNEKIVSLEVLDEKTNVAIISNIAHPDIGTLKKSIESNEQRLVNIYKSNVEASKLELVDLFILYQPDASFDRIYKQIQLREASSFMVLGKSTDLNFINAAQNYFIIETGYPIQEVFAVPNKSFTKFDISEYSFEGFPPLESDTGPVVVLGLNETLLNMRVKGVEMESPMLAIVEEGTVKHAVLIGEDIWKWRLHSYRNDQSFVNFDGFLGKLILYLSTSKTKNRFILDYKPIYNNSNEARIRVNYFDEAFIFDSNASINLRVQKKNTKETIELPMLLREGYYEVDLKNLAAGEYTFTATVKEENLSKSGSFTILDFDAEKQYTSSNHRKLQSLASQSKGELYFPDELDSLLGQLKTDSMYVPTQKSKQIIVPLINFKFLLLVIIGALGLEWFLRKYNGLT